MKEAWLFQGAVVPVDTETTQALVAEIKRLIDVVGGMALAQRTWVGLTDEERDGKRVLENGLLFNTAEVQVWEMAVEWAEQKLKGRNA